MHSLILTSLFYSTQRCVLLAIKVLWICVLVAVCLRQETWSTWAVVALLSCHTANQTHYIVLFLDVYLSLYNSVVHSCTQLILL